MEGNIILRLFLFVFLFCSTVSCYVISQSLHFNNLYNSREPVSEALTDPNVDDFYRQKLRFVLEVLTYGKKNGLNTEGAYRYFIQTPKKAISYLVVAAEPDHLEFVTWWFPVVGTMPYLGFFSKEERDEKAQKLSESGYDVSSGSVEAFSSLGWLDDPIFSTMLYRDDVDLAHLFFHELVHRTIWINGEAMFNENLAEFGAGFLVKKFFGEKAREKELLEQEVKNKDLEKFKRWLFRLRLALEELYRHPPDSKEKLLKEKRFLFDDFLKKESRPKFEKYDFIEKKEWNNATVLSSSLYSPDTDRFEKALNCLQNKEIKNFFEILANKLKKIKKPFKALDSLCASD